MGLFSSGSDTVKTQTTPWGPLKAPLKYGIKTAYDLAQQPMPYYPGDTTAGMSGDTASALGMTRGLAGTNWSAGALPYASLLGSGDLSANPFWGSAIGQQTLGSLSGALGGNPWASAGLSSGPGAYGVGSIMGAASPSRNYGQIGQWLWNRSAPGRTMTGSLMGTAGGSYLDPASNPTWGNYANAAADAVQRQTTARYLGAGQTLDNPAVAQSFARDFSSAMAPYASQAYEAERARQLQATGMIGDLLQSGGSLSEQGYQNQAQRGLQAGGLLANLGAGGTDDALKAASLMGGLYGTNQSGQIAALGMIPGLERASYLPAAMLQGAGQAQEGYTQADMNDALQRYQYGQMEPWNRLALMNGVLQPSMRYGTSSQEVPTPSTFSNILGAAGSIAGIGSLFGGAGGGSGLAGAASAFTPAGYSNPFLGAGSWFGSMAPGGMSGASLLGLGLI